jgi:hypothetical protein
MIDFQLDRRGSIPRLGTKALQHFGVADHELPAQTFAATLTLFDGTIECLLFGTTLKLGVNADRILTP